MIFKLEASLNAISVCNKSQCLAIAGRNLLKVYNIRIEIGHPIKIEELMNLRRGRNLNQGCTDISWNPEQTNILASATANGSLILWDMEKTSPTKQTKTITQHTRAVNRLCFNPGNSNILLSGSQDGSMKCFDIKNQQTTHIFSGNTDSVRDVNFNPHNTNVFAAGQENGTIQLWDLRVPAAPFREFSAHNGPAFSCEWYPYAPNLLGSAGRDKFIKVWDISYLPRLEKSLQSFASISRIKWKPVEHYKNAFTTSDNPIENGPFELVSTCLVFDHNVNLWDLQKPWTPKFCFYPHNDIVTGISWYTPHLNDNDTSYIVSCSKDATLAIYKPPDCVTTPHLNLNDTFYYTPCQYKVQPFALDWSFSGTNHSMLASVEPLSLSLNLQESKTAKTPLDNLLHLMTDLNIYDNHLQGNHDSHEDLGASWNLVSTDGRRDVLEKFILSNNMSHTDSMESHIIDTNTDADPSIEYISTGIDITDMSGDQIISEQSFIMAAQEDENFKPNGTVSDSHGFTLVSYKKLSSRKNKAKNPTSTRGMDLSKEWISQKNNVEGIITQAYTTEILPQNVMRKNLSLQFTKTNLSQSLYSGRSSLQPTNTNNMENNESSTKSMSNTPTSSVVVNMLSNKKWTAPISRLLSPTSNFNLSTTIMVNNKNDMIPSHKYALSPFAISQGPSEVTLLENFAGSLGDKSLVKVIRIENATAPRINEPIIPHFPYDGSLTLPPSIYQDIKPGNVPIPLLSTHVTNEFAESFCKLCCGIGINDFNHRFDRGPNELLESLQMSSTFVWFILPLIYFDPQICLKTFINQILQINPNDYDDNKNSQITVNSNVELATRVEQLARNIPIITACLRPSENNISPSKLHVNKEAMEKTFPDNNLSQILGIDLQKAIRETLIEETRNISLKNSSPKSENMGQTFEKLVKITPLLSRKNDTIDVKMPKFEHTANDVDFNEDFYESIENVIKAVEMSKEYVDYHKNMYRLLENGDPSSLFDPMNEDIAMMDNPRVSTNAIVPQIQINPLALKRIWDPKLMNRWHSANHPFILLSFMITFLVEFNHDLQTACHILILCGSGFLQHLNRIRVAHWFGMYIGQLRQQKLFCRANNVIKSAPLEEINAINRTSTYYASKKGRRKYICAVCELPVNTLFISCECLHGGHIAHYKSWFKANRFCPTGCGHECLCN